ncbi:MAG: deoxynucleoside kinase [Rikenellaceae bacterium]
MYIAVAGNIGSGKTTLTKLLSERLNIEAHFETSDNPYISDFYEDMNRWSFNLQTYFLCTRVKQGTEILSHGNGLIQDRTIYEDAHIFALNLHEMGLLSSRDYQTYLLFFEVVAESSPNPDVIIYLKASVKTLITQIKKRGRSYENTISEEYLERLNLKYENWINNIYKGKVITIDIDNCNFVDHSNIIDEIIDRINEVCPNK